MQSFRRIPQLGRLVLLWFVLSLGVAGAAPLVQPQDMQLVCTSAGAVKMLVKSGDGVRELGAGHFDCPLCALTGAPPPAAPVCDAPHAMPLGHVLRAIPAARLAALTAAPLPARGPPARV